MRLTPLDIREQQFRRVMRGLDPEEVATFLVNVAAEYESVVAENKELRQNVLDLEEQIVEFRTMEKALRDTLLTAERVMAETKDNAQKEAALIVREAELAAQRATSGLSQEVLDKRRELLQLEQRRREYVVRMRAFVQSHLDMLQDGESRSAPPAPGAAPAVAASQLGTPVAAAAPESAEVTPPADVVPSPVVPDDRPAPPRWPVAPEWDSTQPASGGAPASFRPELAGNAPDS